MKKKMIIGISGGILALGLIASSIGLSLSNKVTETTAMDDTYLYFKTPWDEDTASIWAFDGPSDKSLDLTKVSGNIWKLARSSLSGYNKFIVRNGTTWGNGQTGNLKTSLFANTDYIEVLSGGSTDTYHWALYGSMNSWSDNGNYYFCYNSTSEVKLTNVSLAANTTFKVVKVRNDGGNDTNTGVDYFGTDKVNQDSSSSASEFEGSGDIKAKNDGTYSFYFNIGGGANSIWITNPNRVAMDGWAEDFMAVDEFCDAGDTDWSTFASRFAALDPGARAYFNDATASNDKNANNIERAAYRYDNAVSVKGKTPFTEAGGKRASAGHIIAPMKGMEGGLTTAIAITAAVGAAATVGLFFIRKRKVI